MLENRDGAAGPGSADRFAAGRVAAPIGYRSTKRNAPEKPSEPLECFLLVTHSRIDDGHVEGRDVIALSYFLQFREGLLRFLFPTGYSIGVGQR